MSTKGYINLSARQTLSWADLRALNRQRRTVLPTCALSVGVSPEQMRHLHETWHDEVSNITPAPAVDCAFLRWESITIEPLPARECLTA